MLFSFIIVQSLLFSAASAHPGHSVQKEVEKRAAFLSQHTNNLNHCDSIHTASGGFDRSVKRRSVQLQNLLKSRDLGRRQTKPYEKSHKSNKPYDYKTKPSEVFSGNRSCVLSPETTEGPFYVTGESIRSDLVDGQQGVPLYLDIQLIDVDTCKPVNGTYLEIWGANSTGVYSGALAVVNGNGGMNDKANLDKAFLRGIQQTDSDGAVQFTTNFPGHYVGRATHLHIITHLESVRPKENNTVWNLRVRHIGQAFFDQALIDAVESTAPYSTNRQSRTANKNDAILIQETANNADPFFEYVQLGSTLKDGVFGWFTFGVNMTYSRSIMAVAQKFKEGGKMVTTNPKIPGFDAMFPGGFPTAYQPGFGPDPTETHTPKVADEEVEQRDDTLLVSS